MPQNDYILVKDPFWDQSNIWGHNSDIEKLTWYEKYLYLKTRFAGDGVLIAVCHWRGKFAVGESAELIYNSVKGYDLTLKESAFGPVLQGLGQPGHIPGALARLGITTYGYFIGGWNYERLANPYEYQEAVSFLDELNCRRKEYDFAVPDLPVATMQLRLF